MNKLQAIECGRPAGCCTGAGAGAEAGSASAGAEAGSASAGAATGGGGGCSLDLVAGVAYGVHLGDEGEVGKGGAAVHLVGGRGVGGQGGGGWAGWWRGASSVFNTTQAAARAGPADLPDPPPKTFNPEP